MLFTHRRQAKFEILRWFFIISIIIPYYPQNYINNTFSVGLIAGSFILRFIFPRFLLHPYLAKFKLIAVLALCASIFIKKVTLSANLIIFASVMLLSIIGIFSDLAVFKKVDPTLGNPITYLRAIPSFFIWIAVFFREQNDLFFSFSCLLIGILYFLNEDFTYSS